MTPAFTRIILAAATVFISATAAADCESLAPAGLDTLAAKKGGELELIFFASWCWSCREHLTQKHGPNTILIGAFDKKERLEATLKALGVTTPCFADDGVADALGVSELPKVMIFHAKK